MLTEGFSHQRQQQRWRRLHGNSRIIFTIYGAPTVCPPLDGAARRLYLSDFLEAGGGDSTTSLSSGPSATTFMEHLLCTSDCTECIYLPATREKFQTVDLGRETSVHFSVDALN